MFGAVGWLQTDRVPRMTSNPAPMSWLAEMSAMSTSGASRTSLSSMVTLLPFSSRAKNDRSPISQHRWEAHPMPLMESSHASSYEVGLDEDIGAKSSQNPLLA